MTRLDAVQYIIDIASRIDVWQAAGAYAAICEVMQWSESAFQQPQGTVERQLDALVEAAQRN